MKILIHKGIEKVEGKVSPKVYPFWSELLVLLKDHEVSEIKVLPPEELKTLLLKADIIICVDSFIQHFCWYVGKQAVVLWGQSDPLIFGHKENINLLKDRKYLRKEQFWKWYQCEKNDDAFLSAEEVYDKLKEIYKI